MLKRNSFNVHWKFGACQKWQPAGHIGDFGNILNGFAKSPRVLRTVLNIEWVQFVFKNCEILHFVWGLYDKNSASYYCFTSDVMYKKYEMLVYTLPELLARFCWVNLSNAKNSAWFVFSMNSFSRSNLLWSRAIMALKCDRRWLLFFGCIYTGYQFDERFFFTLKSLSLSFP